MRLLAPAPALLTLLLLSCRPEVRIGTDTGTGQQPPTAQVTLPPAFDPIGGEPLSVDTHGADLEVTVLDSQGTVVQEGETTWGGRVDGDWATPGLYTVRVRNPASGAQVEHTVNLVRAGVITAWAEGDGGHTASRIPLYWHRGGHLQDVSDPFVSIESLDDEEGEPVPFPDPTDELTFYEEGSNEPLAFSYDSRPLLTFTLGEDSALGGTGLPVKGLRLEMDGWEQISEENGLDPAVPVVMQATEPLGSSLGTWTEELELRFVAEDTEGTSWTVATQILPVRWYATLAPPTFEDEGEAYTAWPAAVEPALEALEGVTPDPAAVLDALVDWVYWESGLSYDTSYGASYYTEYRQGDWTRAHFQAGAFLERRYGSVVNCSDCASILVFYANMLGAPLYYTIILRNFELNYIRAIGYDTYTHCPFGGGGCGFNYHAVTTDDGAATIWDATLALDGDGDPGHSPCEELLVQAVDGDEYLDRLVMAGQARYQYESQGTLQ